MASRDYFLEDYIRTEDIGLDKDGQPHAGLNAHHRLRRGLSEMLGLCKGFLADGQLADSEIDFLNTWFQANQDVVCDFPAREIYARIQRVIRDGIITDDEREDLADLISKACGGKDGPLVHFKEPEATMAKVYNSSTAMPFNDPEPPLQFEGQGYSFTGKFVSGTRNWCAQQVIVRGGRFDDVPSARTNVLVIGSLGSRDWAHTSFGRKIEAAMRYKPRLAIVSEEHWVKYLRPTANVGGPTYSTGAQPVAS